MDEVLVNVSAKVNNDAIRHITHNGRPHIVVPSYTLPDDVIMNGGLYEKDEIAKSYKSLEGTLSPVGHPVVDGKHVKANVAEAINAHHVGVWNKNVEQVDGRVYLEKWVDVQKAEESQLGRELLDAINKGDPIHTSTGIIMKREMVANGNGFKWKARDMRFDHDAILFGEPGAATPEDGVGMMVNSADGEMLVINSVSPVVNAAVLKVSYNQLRERISASVRERFSTNDSYAWVSDFDDSTVVYETNKGMMSIGYTMDGENAILEGEPVEVVARTEFVVKDAPLALFKNSVECNPDSKKNPTPSEPPMDEAQLKAIIESAVKPFGDQLTAVNTALAAVQDENKAMKEQLQTNAKEADAENRAVILAKAPDLEITVNALSGEPLALLAASYQSAAPLLSGFQVNAKKEGDLSGYEGV